MCINLVGAGGQIDVEEMVHLLKCPSAVSVGLFIKFLIVPAVSTVRGSTVLLAKHKLLWSYRPRVHSLLPFSFLFEFILFKQILTEINQTHRNDQ